MPPLAYRFDAAPAVDPALLPTTVASYDLNPGDVTLGFCSATPTNHDVPTLFRDLDPASLHITQQHQLYFMHTGATPVARLSRKSPTAAKEWPANPTTMTVESPVILVRETADEQNFIVLATLTAAQ